MGRCRDICPCGSLLWGFIALDYAIRHGDKLRGLILRDTWANGVLGSMTALANILTSDRIKVDVARQVRVWSGTLHDDKDFEEAVQEILPFYAPPEDPSSIESVEDKPESTEFLGSNSFHSATQNAAFGVNMPRFDVRHQLKDIKVKRRTICLNLLHLNLVRFPRSSSSGAMTKSPR